VIGYSPFDLTNGGGEGRLRGERQSNHEAKNGGRSNLIKKSTTHEIRFSLSQSKGEGARMEGNLISPFWREPAEKEAALRARC